MGEIIARDTVIDVLQRLNPKAKRVDIVLYADLYCDYAVAQANINEHGSIVFHPRTGAPINNPYLSVRDKARDGIKKIRLSADELWV